MGKALCEASPAARAVFEEADACPRLPPLAAVLRGARGGAQAHRQHAAGDPDALDRGARGPARPLSRAARGRGVRRGPLARRVLGQRRRRRRSSFADAVRWCARAAGSCRRPCPPASGRWRRSWASAPEAVEAACREAARGEVVAPANYNSPEQTVIAGNAPRGRARVRRPASPAGPSGRSRCRSRRPSTAPSCRPRARRCGRCSRRPRFSDAAHPGRDQRRRRRRVRGARLRDALVRQIDSPVRWVESVQRLAREGVDRALEIGPGNVLAGLVRRIERAIKVEGYAGKRSRLRLDSDRGPGSRLARSAAPARFRRAARHRRGLRRGGRRRRERRCQCRMGVSARHLESGRAYALQRRRGVRVGLGHQDRRPDRGDGRRPGGPRRPLRALGR